ncbi:MAG: ABC transporter ATP-binding protein [Actinomycetota bacterium]
MTLVDEPTATENIGETAAPDPEAATITATSGIGALMGFAKPALGRFALSGVLAAISALLSLVPFWAIYRTIDDVVTGEPIRGDLWWLSAIALASIIGRFVLFGLSTGISHIAAYQMLYGIRVKMAERLGRVPLGYVTRRRSGEIKKVMGDDVERLELFLAHGIPDIVSAVVVLFAIPIWLFIVDWRMAIATLVLAIPAFVCMAFAMRRSMRNMDEYHSTLAEMNASVVELIRGMPVVKVFNRGTDRVRDAERAIDRHVEVVKIYSADFLPLGTAFYVLLAANIMLLIPLGVWLFDDGSISDTDLLFFFVVGLGALVPITSLLHLFANMSHLSSGGNLVQEIMEAATLDDPDVSQVPADATVTLEAVSFGYGDRRVLHDIDLRAEPGTITALVGPSGAGKTTVASLIARFWDVDEGRVTVGGVDVRDVAPDELARHVAIVLQDTFLFDDTIAANLRVANSDATEAELHGAARAASAHDFVMALPLGYDTVVGERGARLSGGERQRLTLARAILADSPVIVLDEATSFADPENESLIQDAIETLIEGKTVIMIAHRLSTIAGADQIVVIDDGRVAERGRHGDLVDEGGTYARLWADFVAAETTSLGDAVRKDEA